MTVDGVLDDLTGISWLAAPSNPTLNDLASDKIAPNNANSNLHLPLLSMARRVDETRQVEDVQWIVRACVCSRHKGTCVCLC
uniref:Uncharacterized protein n=2 Tax=Onchocerca ochengi TaxID=42157 RepID=A0A182E969_ONCOC